MFLQIRSPLSTLYSGIAHSVSFESPDGECQILPNHCPMLSIISIGIITICAESHSNKIQSIIFAERGICIVQGDHNIEIFCTGAIDIKAHGAEAIKQKLQSILKKDDFAQESILQYEKAISKALIKAKNI